MTKQTESKARFPRVAGDEWVDVYAVRTELYSNVPVQTLNHGRQIVSPIGTFAMQCMERWAMVAGEPNGEDAAGRQKLRRMTAGELSKHACDCAETLFNEFRARGWIASVPNLEAFIDAVKDVENGND